MSRLFIRVSSAQITAWDTDSSSYGNAPMTPRPLRPSRPHCRGLLLVCTSLLAGASTSCTPTVLPATTIWSANLEPLTPAGVKGIAAVVSQFGETRASMQVNLGEAGATYLWRMSEGDCTTEGDIVAGRAAYPLLNVSASGAADADATLAGELTSGGSYAARIVDDSGSSEQVLACGVLVQTK